MGDVADAVWEVTLLDDDEPTLKNVVACLQRNLGITNKEAWDRLNHAIWQTGEVELRTLKVKVVFGDLVGRVSGEVLGMDGEESQGEVFAYVTGEVLREVTDFRLVVPPNPLPVSFIERPDDEATA